MSWDRLLGRLDSGHDLQDEGGKPWQGRYEQPVTQKQLPFDWGALVFLAVDFPPLLCLDERGVVGVP